MLNKKFLLVPLFFLTIFVCSNHGYSQKDSNSVHSSAKFKGFIKNNGQIIDQNGNSNTKVLYLLNTPGLNVQLNQNGFAYDLYEIPEKKHLQNYTGLHSKSQLAEKAQNPALNKLSFQRLDFEFLNTNESLAIKEFSKSKSYSNYYNIEGHENGVINVPSFEKIIYNNIYDGINLEFIVPSDPLKPIEYNFIISPEADISDIKFKVSGANVLLENHALKMQLVYGTLRELIPGSWIEKNSNKEKVQVNYVEIDKNTFGFCLEDQFFPDSSNLIIDPTPVREWGTYIGGDLFEGSPLSSMDYDSQGNTYYSGWTQSDNIATSGSHQTNNFIFETPLTHQTGLIMKFNPSGELLWASYYGGMNPTEFYDLKTDSDNNVIGVGYTYSDTHIATPNAHQEDISGENDGFVVKFNTNGQRLWGSYFGGKGQDFLRSVSVDNENNIYVGGYTGSTSDILYGNSFDTQYGNLNDAYATEAFLAKLDKNGNIKWSTYYGGENEDFITSLEIGPDSKLYVLGYTNSLNDIATEGTYKPNLTMNGSQTNDRIDSFIVKFDLQGNRIWGTYFGGDAIDWGYDLAIDRKGDLIIAGVTQSTTEIAQSTSHQNTKGGGIADWDDFIAKFNNSGSLLWSTYYGGPELENYVSCAVDTDAYNNIYLAGGTSSSSNIATSCSYKENFDGYENAFLVKFDELGNRLWGTYYGENQVTGTDVKIVKESIYMFGVTSSETGVASENAYQPQIKLEDNFIVKFKEGTESVRIEATKIICENEDIIFQASGGTSYHWTGPNNFESTKPNPIIPNASSINAGLYEVYIESNSGCDQTRQIMVDVTQPPVANKIETLIGCDDDNDGFSTNFDTSNINAQVLGDQNGMEITYFDESGNELPNPLPNPYSNTTANQEILTVRVTRANTECYSETQVKLKTSSKPKINKPKAIYACNDAGGYGYFDTSTIENQLIGSQGGLIISYFDQSGNKIPSPFPENFKNTVAWKQEIFVMVENETNSACYAETSFELIVNKFPEIELEDNYFICGLEPFLSISSNKDYDSWLWTSEDGSIISQSSEVNLEDSGNYTLQVSKTLNDILCEKSFNFNVTRSNLPEIININFQELSNNNYIEINASGDGNFEYSLDGENYQDEKTFYNLSGGIYTAEVRDKDGCGSDFREVVILDYPKFFTPNNDGVNDYWQIKGATKIKDSRIRIFDRYGKLLKELSSNQKGWDGTFNGKPMPSNDYWFLAYLRDGRSFKGHFSLVRKLNY